MKLMIRNNLKMNPIWEELPSLLSISFPADLNIMISFTESSKKSFIAFLVPSFRVNLAICSSECKLLQMIHR